MIDCKNCLHSGLCLHEDKAEEYIKQHKAMRDKCSLFDGEPTCNRFINKKILQEIETLKTRNKSQAEIIDNLTNRIKRDADKNILDKYRKGSKPKIYTCQDKEVPRVTYRDQYEDERTATEDKPIYVRLHGGFTTGEMFERISDFIKEYQKTLR